MLAQTEQDDLRIWSDREYFSSAGNFFVISKISITAFIDALHTFPISPFLPVSVSPRLRFPVSPKGFFLSRENIVTYFLY